MLDLDELYLDYCENDAEMATDEVKRTYQAVNGAIEEYIVAVESAAWKEGFKYAMKLAGKEVQV